MNLSRRGFLSGLVAAAVAPAIIRTPGLIMPIKPGLVPVRAPVRCGMMLRTRSGSFFPVNATEGLAVGMARALLSTPDIRGAVFLGDREDVHAFEAECIRDQKILFGMDTSTGLVPTYFRGTPIIERESYYAAMMAERAARPPLVMSDAPVHFDIRPGAVNRLAS